MSESPPATPLDDAAEALCTARGIKSNARANPDSTGDYTSNKVAARPESAAAVTAYLESLASEPFFIQAIEQAIEKRAEGITAAEAAIAALQPDAIGALFPEQVPSPDLTGINIAWLGGHCPVQAEGSADGVAFYFRARGAKWEIWIGDQRHCFSFHPDIWSYQEPFRIWPEAGWMSEDLARHYIAQGVARWRAHKAPTAP